VSVTLDAPSDQALLCVHADASGAAQVMRAVVGLPGLASQLVEDAGGRWRVSVRVEADLARALTQVLDVVTRCIDEGGLRFAVVELDGRTFALGDPAPSRSLLA
jgi:hypothetical protein